MDLSSFLERDYRSFLAGQHPAFILLEIIVLSVSVSVCEFPALVAILPLFGIMLVAGAIPVIEVVRGIVSFWPLFVCIALAPFFSGSDIQSAGAESLLVLTRFAFYITIGIISFRSLAPDRLQYVVYRIVKILPFVNACRIAAIIRIVFALVPQLSRVITNMRDARDSRAGGYAQGRIRNIVSQGYSLAAYFLVRANLYADALESRLFDVKKVPDCDCRFEKRALLFCAAFIVLCSLIVYANYMFLLSGDKPAGVYFM